MLGVTGQLNHAKVDVPGEMEAQLLRQETFARIMHGGTRDRAESNGRVPVLSAGSMRLCGSGLGAELNTRPSILMA